jgi:hypothetical protein
MIIVLEFDLPYFFINKSPNLLRKNKACLPDSPFVSKVCRREEITALILDTFFLHIEISIDFVLFLGMLTFLLLGATASYRNYSGLTHIKWKTQAR